MGRAALDRLAAHFIYSGLPGLHDHAARNKGCGSLQYIEDIVFHAVQFGVAWRAIAPSGLHSVMTPLGEEAAVHKCCGDFIAFYINNRFIRCIASDNDCLWLSVRHQLPSLLASLSRAHLDRVR